MERHRLFLDANILFSAAYRPNAGLLRFWQLPNITLLSSEYALEEAKRNLETAEQKNTLKELLKKVEVLPNTFASIALPISLTLPPKDQPIIVAALSAKADYLITGDFRHFGPFFKKKIAGIIILPPAEYLYHTRRNLS